MISGMGNIRFYSREFTNFYELMICIAVGFNQRFFLFNPEEALAQINGYYDSMG